MPPAIPRDTALPLKVKDGRSILALYPVHLDTNIKLAVSWYLKNEGLFTSTPRTMNLNVCLHGIQWTACQWGGGVFPSQSSWWGRRECIAGPHWCIHHPVVVERLHVLWIVKQVVADPFKACTRITSVFCSPSVPWDDSTQEEQTPDEWQKSKTRVLGSTRSSPTWQQLGSQARKACERCNMSQYLLHILCLSSSIRAGRYFYYILNWSCSQMLMLLKKKFWISSSFPRWYCPWIIYYFISDLFSISFVNK